ncbi:MAG: CapA family protein [Lachnospiraceae bacterium]|nr:CapA family protein [Lachnospiraceae bacterium]
MKRNRKKKSHMRGALLFLLFTLVLLGVVLAATKQRVEMQKEASANRKEEMKQEQTESEEPKPITITISATGDCTFSPTQSHGYAGSFHEYYDKFGADYFMKSVKDIFSEDSFTLVNLECALSDSTQRAEKEYVLVGKPEYAEVLSRGAIEGVSLANNHSLDAFETGLQDTMDAVRAQGVGYAYYDKVGTYETPEGITIGYVSSSLLSHGVDREEYLKNGIEKLREMKVDLVIACCHWGEERTYYPTEYQKQMAHNCIDWGADLVIGNHPHVVQGIENYNGKMICYSLGNFCFGGNSNPGDKRTFIYQQSFTFVDGQLQDDVRARMIPCRVSSVSGYNDYQPTPVEGEEAGDILQAMREYSSGLFFGEIGEGGEIHPE